MHRLCLLYNTCKKSAARIHDTYIQVDMLRILKYK